MPQTLFWVTQARLDLHGTRPVPTTLFCLTQLQFQLLRKPDMKHNHIEAIPKIVVRHPRTEQLTRAFTELTTGKIEVNQVCFPRLCLAPHPETD